MEHTERQGFFFSDFAEKPRPAAACVWTHSSDTVRTANGFVKDLWVLDYSLVGNSEGRTGTLDWISRPAWTAHLYPPGTSYMERNPAGRMGGAYFLFSGENRCIRDLVSNSQGFARIHDPGRRLLACIRKGADAASLGNQGYWKFCGAFQEAMELLETISAPAGPDWNYVLAESVTDVKPLALRLLEFLEQHYMAHFTMKQLAEKFGCSQSTLTHKFRATYHESIWDRLQRIRIEQSIPLLNNGKPLKEIAAGTGFVNEFYYSRVFRKIIGMSPRQYRNQYPH